MPPKSIDTPIEGAPVERAPELPSLTPAERESFFAGIVRHRRAAARVALVGGICAAMLAFVVAVLMAPLWYAVIGLALDLANRVVPTPDLIRIATDTVSGLIEHPQAVPPARWLHVLLLAALPGLVAMALAWRTLGRIVREAIGSDATGLPARAIDASVLAEQRFADVVAEMAIAAGLASPRVLVADNVAVNAAAFGADRSHASIVVTTGLLAELDRAQLQGVAADLVGSIANGDMRAGARFATVLGMFGLIAKLGDSFADRDAARRFGKLLRRSLRPGSSTADAQLAMELANPFEQEKQTPAATRADPDGIPWRTLAWMPLVGPMVISGFFGGLLCTVLLGPLLSLTWRRRKYLADATAVQLTRDPDTLGGALEKLRGAPVEGAFGAWIAHLGVVSGGAIGAKGLLGGSGVPMFPSLDRRLKALGVMGAHITSRPGRAWPLWAWCVVAPLAALVVVLLGMVVVGLLYVSMALSALFTWVPAALLNALLR